MSLQNCDKSKIQEAFLSSDSILVSLNSPCSVNWCLLLNFCYLSPANFRVCIMYMCNSVICWVNKIELESKGILYYLSLKAILILANFSFNSQDTITCEIFLFTAKTLIYNCYVHTVIQFACRSQFVHT